MFQAQMNWLRYYSKPKLTHKSKKTAIDDTHEETD
jgi:hypothetical protein